MLELTFNDNLKTEKTGRDFFYAVFEKASAATSLGKKRVGLSLNLVGEKKIRSLNKTYRRKNKATDVLSFPLNEKVNEDLPTSPVRVSTSAGAMKTSLRQIDSDGASAKMAENDILELGDIFICRPVARENALKQKIDLKTELELLAVHGFLHLLGYDHETPSREKEMISLQNKILK